MQPKQIAIIEDDVRIIEFIRDYLINQPDYIVKGFTSGIEALNAIKLNPPDVVLLDLGLGDIKGEDICSQLRQQYPTLPILILTGNKSEQSVINCLNLGADDYITKPFNMGELIARIEARLRNNRSAANDPILRSHDLELNQETLEVKRAGKPVTLTPREFELLRYLLVNKSRVITRDKILDAVWGYSADIYTRSIDVHIGKLRKKLDTGHKVKLIESLRGFGYKIID
jgi:DNA-binding response OmpR family regulator